MKNRLTAFIIALGIVLSSASLGVNAESNAKPKGYLDDIKGYKDTVVLQTSAESSMSESDLLPYVAYLGTEGNISGKMFDSAMFFSTNHYSTNPFPTDKNTWESWLNNLFGKDATFSSLDKTVDRVYSELGVKSKYGVFVALPYPEISENAFGDIDGDGEVEYCRDEKERAEIIEWFVKKTIEGFKSQKYQNLKFVGFVWFQNTSKDADLIFAKETVKYIKNRGYITVYVGDVFRVGNTLDYDKIDSVGFYASSVFKSLGNDGTIPETDNYKVFATDLYTKGLGAVVDCGKSKEFFGEHYISAGHFYEILLYCGEKFGYMGGTNIYFQNGYELAELCFSDIKTPQGIYTRRMYDITYSYIHGVYKNLSPTVMVEDMELVAGDDSLTADIIINDSDSHWEDIHIVFTQKPSNGRVASAADKKLIIYSPDEGFVGEDSFTLLVYDSFNTSEEITVRVTVASPDENSDEIADISEDASRSSGNNENKTPLWLVIVLVVLAVAVVAVAVGSIVGRKKTPDNTK